MVWPSHPRYRGRAGWFLRKTSRLWEGTVMGLVIDIVLFVAGMVGGMLVVSLCVAARMGDMQARRPHSERDRAGQDLE